MDLLLCNTRSTHASPTALRKRRKHIMSESILTPLNNARQISQCVPEILQTGPLARCANCAITSCRSQMGGNPQSLTVRECSRST